jgi:CRISPR-associated endonuclease Cas2
MSKKRWRDYRKSKKNDSEETLSLSAKVLFYLFAIADFVPEPLEHKTAYVRRVIFGQGSNNYKAYWKIFNYLERKGWVKVYTKEKADTQFVKLTKKGQLQTLLMKAVIQKPQKWDGKWRMIIYDIPEDSRKHRYLFRKLLKQNGFYQFQQSVFINPYPLNKEAITYLQQTGLDKYIRIVRVDQLDREEDLKKYFGLV